MTCDERIMPEGNPSKLVNISLCIRCKFCDMAAVCGTTAVVNCTKRETVLFNCRVAQCKFFEARVLTEQDLIRDRLEGSDSEQKTNTRGRKTKKEEANG